jgi:hypothetical protein
VSTNTALKCTLHRYLAEFDFRYDKHNVADIDRVASAMKGIVGKQLTYRDSLGVAV